MSRIEQPSADTQPPGPDTSWFANFALDEDADDGTAASSGDEPRRWYTPASASPSDDPPAAAAWRAATPGPSLAPDSVPPDQTRPASGRGARALLTPGVPSFVRLYRTFLGARAALAMALLAMVLLGAAFSTRTNWLVPIVAAAYALGTIVAWALPPPRPVPGGTVVGRLSRRAWLLTIGVDIAVLGVVHAGLPPGGLNVPLLMALPVLMSGVMTPRRWALASAAAVTLVLLAVAWAQSAQGGELTVLMTQAGLIGAGLFAIAVLAGDLSTRLATEQESARGSLEIARQQAQLNRLVISEMQDGVLVVDRKGRVRAANPAARRLLAAEGRTRAAPFQMRGVADWAPLVEAVEQAFLEGSWPDAGREVTLPLASPRGVALRELRLRVRFTRKRDGDAREDLCVLFIEDVRNIYARVRQEKLAAMGRMSAGIAHEIRNPLAAIAQANALLAEDATSDAQRQLTGMIGANVGRLQRIVEDVLDVAPGERAAAPLIDVPSLVRQVCDEWRRTAELPGALAGDDAAGGLHLHLDALRQAGTEGTTPAPRLARFEPDHLRRVLVNLLDNAWRHGTHTAGSVQLRVDGVAPLREGDAPVIVLSVANDGNVIPPQVERSLFEPFFSTRSRGTGLGLYICRELCERYGASIDYRQQDEPARHRNEFVVTLRAAHPTAPAASPAALS